MPMTRANGTGLWVEDTGGDGEAIVFAHGLFWSGRMYEAQIAALRGRYRCICYDHRGQGRSEIAADGYDMENVAADAQALLAALGLGPVHWVGLSMGGFCGMRLAARKPALIRSLALLDTAADTEPHRFKYQLLGNLARIVGMRPFIGESMRALFGKPFLSDPARASEREELRGRLLANNPRGSIRALLGVADRKGVEGELSEIRCPTLVLSGERDVAILPERSRQTAAKIAGARFELIPRAGHSSTMEEPAAVTAALEAFLAGLHATRAAASPG